MNNKISNGQVLGLDDVILADEEGFILADEEGFDALIQELSKLSFYTPEKIEVLTGKRLIL